MTVTPDDDQRWLACAIGLCERARGFSKPNPNVGCVIVKDGHVVGRGWTGKGGRPHAEAVALDQAGTDARGATLYVSLEPCAHASMRGPACSDMIARAGIDRVVVAMTDPDARTHGKGIDRLRGVGVEVEVGSHADSAALAMAPWLTRMTMDRPYITLKLAVTADGRISLPAWEERWITGPVARAHGHMERTRHEAILVGRGTLEADNPRLDVRLPGLESRSPQRLLLTQGTVPEGWQGISDLHRISTLPYQSLLVEGGAGAAKAFLEAGMVDRILLYRAPIVAEQGENVLAEIGLFPPGAEWVQTDSRMLGIDRLNVYERA